MRREILHLIVFSVVMLTAIVRAGLEDFREEGVFMRVAFKGYIEETDSYIRASALVLESEIEELEGRRASLKVLGYVPTETGRLSILGNILVRDNRVYITASAEDVWVEKSIRNTLIERYDRISKNEEASALGRSFLFGDPREGIPSEVQKDFLSTGLVHLLVISGLHVGTVGLILYKALPRNMGLNLALLGIPLYTYFIVPNDPPVLRASLMFMIMVASALTFRRVNTLAVLLFSGSVILAVYPHYVFSYSFWLSFLATAYILLMMRDLEGGKVFKSVAVSSSAFTGTAPLVGSFSFLSPVSVILTPLIAPIVFIYALLGVASLITFMSFPPLVDMFNLAGLLFLKVVDLASSISFQIYPHIGVYEAIFLSVAGIVALYMLKGRLKLIPVASINGWLLVRSLA